MSERSFFARIIDWDKNAPFPIVLMFLMISVVFYSAADQGWLGSAGTAYAHFMHNDIVHYSFILVGLWFFFLRIGAEITISEVIAAGGLVIGATIGGMLVPIVLTTTVVYSMGGLQIMTAVYASAGAMATDVPLAIGSARSVEKVVCASMGMALTIMAVGDDVGVLMAMTGLSASDITQVDAIMWEGLILLICGLIGRRGDMSYKEMDGDTTISEKTIDVTVKSPIIWITICVLNTYFLGRNGIEPILGGCLPMIFAPTDVKHLIAEKTEAIALWLLILFAMVAGSVNIFSDGAIGVYTWVACLCGHYTKVIGIFSGGFIGRKRTAPEGEFGVEQFDNKSLLAMAIAGGCNGTVAIIIVDLFASRGLIPVDIAGQMKIGFLLTVPLSFGTNYVLAKIWKNADSQSIIKEY